METFGEYLRGLRQSRKMRIRKLAAALDIDSSTLSKIERNERQATKAFIPVIAQLFDIGEKEVAVKFWAEKITYELRDEAFALEALKVAEQEITFLKNKP